MADKDGWPAMGTFDYINMRINGYEFHVGLMGARSRGTRRSQADFNKWAELPPYHASGAHGRRGSRAPPRSQAGRQVPPAPSSASRSPTPAEPDDLDFFPYPTIDSENGQEVLDAPIDGLMIAKKPKNEEGRSSSSPISAAPQAENAYLTRIPNNAGEQGRRQDRVRRAPEEGGDEIAKAKHIARYMDRDSRPDFASTVAIPSFESFLKNPSTSSIDGTWSSMEKQAKRTIFGVVAKRIVGERPHPLASRLAARRRAHGAAVGGACPGVHLVGPARPVALVGTLPPRFLLLALVWLPAIASIAGLVHDLGRDW